MLGRGQTLGDMVSGRIGYFVLDLEILEYGSRASFEDSDGERAILADVFGWLRQG